MGELAGPEHSRAEIFGCFLRDAGQGPDENCRSMTSWL
jgi:hypothetical protein